MDGIEMFSIDKSNWTKTRFGDVVFEPKESVSDLVAEGIKYVVGLEHIEPEDIHLTKFSGLEKSTTFTKRFSKGDVLFGRRRAYLKKAAKASFEGVCSGDITVMRCTKALEPELLPFIVNNDKFFDFAITHSAGGLSPRVKFKDLSKYEIMLPAIDEQRKLLNLFRLITEVLNSKKEALNKIDLLLRSFQGEKLNFGYGGNSPELPDGWKVMKIREFSKVQAGSTPLRSNKKFFENGDIPWLKTLDLNNGSIVATEEYITDLAIKSTSCKIKPPGTVLVAMYGGFNQIGRTGILEIEAATNQAVSAIEVDELVINPKFLLYVLNYRREYWKKVAISSRKDPNITKDDVENFPVSMPCLHLQNQIVKDIDEILDAKSKLEADITAFHIFSRALASKVF